MEWYYTKDKKQVGPISQQDLIQKISVGEVSSNDYAWHEGVTDWQPISKFPELNITSGPVVGAQPPVASGSPSPSAAPAPYQSVSSVNTTSGLAIASLCLGIASIMSLGICCGMPMGILLGIPAIICGHMAIGGINASNGQLEGKPMAIIGLIMGYLMSLWSIAVIIFFAVMSTVPSLSGHMDYSNEYDYAWEESMYPFEMPNSQTSSSDEPPVEDLLPENDQ